MGLVKVIYEENRRSEVINSEEARKLRELEYEYGNISDSLKKYMEKVKDTTEIRGEKMGAGLFEQTSNTTLNVSSQLI